MGYWAWGCPGSRLLGCSADPLIPWGIPACFVRRGAWLAPVTRWADLCFRTLVQLVAEQFYCEWQRLWGISHSCFQGSCHHMRPVHLYSSQFKILAFLPLKSTSVFLSLPLTPFSSLLYHRCSCLSARSPSFLFQIPELLLNDYFLSSLTSLQCICHTGLGGSF